MTDTPENTLLEVHAPAASPAIPQVHVLVAGKDAPTHAIKDRMSDSVVRVSAVLPEDIAHQAELSSAHALLLTTPTTAPSEAWVRAATAALFSSDDVTAVAIPGPATRVDALPWHMGSAGDANVRFDAPVDALLIDREALVELGPIAVDLPAPWRDLDLGWRIHQRGGIVRCIADPDSAGGSPAAGSAPADAIATLHVAYRNAETDLRDTLVASILLADAVTAADDSAPTRAAKAIADVLPAWIDERQRIQALRRTTDGALLETWGRTPLAPAGANAQARERLASVSAALAWPSRLLPTRAERVLVLAYDAIGARMAGPGVRSWEIAKALAKQGVAVTVAAPFAIEREASGVSTALFQGPERLQELLEEHDVVLVQGHAIHSYPQLKHMRALLVVDLYDPWVFEDLEMQRRGPRLDGERLNRRDVDVHHEMLDAGDFFICASERQRDYWLGMLTSRGRLDRAAYAQDPSLRSLIDVLPYGCPAEPPTAAPVLKGVNPNVPEDAFLLLWSGGTWEWFDPENVLEAFAQALETEPRLRLFFMGMELEGRGIPEMPSTHRLRQRAKDLGLAGTHVLEGGWVPYDERGAYLLEADAAVIATRDLAETRLAFRSRVLDHFWAGLPTITTDGDILAEIIVDNDAGIAVPANSIEALRDAMLALAADPARTTQMSHNAQALAERHTWDDSVLAMSPLLTHPMSWHARREYRSVPTHFAQDAQLAIEAIRAERQDLREAHDQAVWQRDEARLQADWALSRLPFWRRVARRITNNHSTE